MYFDHILPHPHAPSIFKLSLVGVAYVSLGVELVEQGQGSYSMNAHPLPRSCQLPIVGVGRSIFFNC